MSFSLLTAEPVHGGQAAWWPLHRDAPCASSSGAASPSMTALPEPAGKAAGGREAASLCSQAAAASGNGNASVG